MIRAVAALFALWIAVPAWAAQVQLVVPYKTLEVGQQGQADLVIVNGSTATVPDLPVADGLDVSFLGQRTDRRMVYGNKTTIRSFTYSVRALREGTFTIGPATIVVDGQPMTTESIVIEVTPPPAVISSTIIRAVSPA